MKERHLEDGANLLGGGDTGRIALWVSNPHKAGSPLPRPPPRRRKSLHGAVLINGESRSSTVNVGVHPVPGAAGMRSGWSVASARAGPALPCGTSMQNSSGSDQRTTSPRTSRYHWTEALKSRTWTVTIVMPFGFTAPFSQSPSRSRTVQDRAGPQLPITLAPQRGTNKRHHFQVGPGRRSLDGIYRQD